MTVRKPRQVLYLSWEGGDALLLVDPDGRIYESRDGHETIPASPELIERAIDSGHLAGYGI